MAHACSEDHRCRAAYVFGPSGPIDEHQLCRDIKEILDAHGLEKTTRELIFAHHLDNETLAAMARDLSTACGKLAMCADERSEDYYIPATVIALVVVTATFAAMFFVGMIDVSSARRRVTESR